MDKDSAATFIEESVDRRDRRPSRLSAISKEGLGERLHTLKRSKGGMVASLTRMYGRIDNLMQDYANVTKVQQCQENLEKTWVSYNELFIQYTNILPSDSDEFAQASDQRQAQEDKKAFYHDKITQYIHEAATFYNGQAYADIKARSHHGTTLSRSGSSRESKVSNASSKLKEAKLAAAVASLQRQQVQEETQLKIDREIRRMELELRQKELAIKSRQEIVRMKADEKVSKATHKEKVAELQAKILSEDICEAGDIGISASAVTLSATAPPFLPTSHMMPTVVSAPTVPISISTAVNATRLPVPASVPATAQGFSMLRGMPQPHQLPTPIITTAPTVCYGDVYPPRPAMVPMSLMSHVQSQVVTTSGIYSANHSAPSAYTASAIPSYSQPVPCSIAAPSNSSETFLKKMAETMDKISLSNDLPAMEVQRFDGSPDKYPVFQHRFRQMVLEKPLDEQTKMSRLLQFLEGSALKAVKQYEAIPGGLAKALELLRSRFGKPFQIVRASVDSLTKGPTITGSDSEALQAFADKAQVVYDTLSTMECLGEVNTSNLELIISRLPKWMQGKFVEHLKKVDREGLRMPSFKDVVTFLQDRAYVANHPFLSKSQETMASTKQKDRGKKDTSFKTTATFQVASDQTAAQATNTKPASDPEKNLSSMKATRICSFCSKAHALFQCEAFKALSVSERHDFIKKNKLCFNCVSSIRHNAKSCPSMNRCKTPGCGKAHHTLLHLPQRRSTQQTNATEQMLTMTTPEAGVAGDVTNYDDENTSKVLATSNVTQSRALLQTLPINVIGSQGKIISTYALIDSGSDITMIDPSLIKLLDIAGQPGELSLSTVSDKSVHKQGTKVDIIISSMENGEQVCIPSAWAITDLTIPLKSVVYNGKPATQSHLKDIYFPPVERKKISILVGTNVPEAFVPLDVRKGGPNDLIAIKSSLGWSILGFCSDYGTVSCNSRATTNHITAQDVHDDLSEQLENFWKVESYGSTSPQSSKTMSVEDRKSMAIIEKTIKKKDGHYEMGLLWKDERPNLPYNRPLAEARLKHLKKRLLPDRSLESKYRAVVEGYMSSGYARKLTNQELSVRSPVTWYLPHHAVVNPNKPKIRVVFDAAAKFCNTSLNDNLMQGPDVTNSLVGVLIRFRQEPIAFTADVAAMFHQVKVKYSDTDALRFLWWTNSLNDPPDEYKMLVHIFGAASSSCCANVAIKKTAAHNASQFSDNVIQTICRNFYVDDCLKSVPSEEEAIDMIADLRNALAQGGFNLTKFTSNRRNVQESVPTEHRNCPTLDLDLDRMPIERALGITWDSESDTFQFKIIKTEKPLTKRGLLSIVSSLYDPIGLLSPFVFLAKVLLQDLWRLQLGWDDALPKQLLLRWLEWTGSLPSLVNVKIPRCYKPQSLGNIKIVQLHNFSDASAVGYAAVSFLRLTDSAGNIHCTFVIGKTRNAPLKEWSIPRLELQAAVLSTRLHTLISTELELPIQKTYFWSDSMTTLQYIRNEKRRFKPFVANRLCEIHESSNPRQWYHVPGKLNPADDGSRGMPIEKFSLDCRWWNGPSFLWEGEEEWPNQQIGQLTPDNKEIKDSGQVTVITESSSLDNFTRRYSSWSHLLKLTSWLVRFVNYIRRKYSKLKKTSNVCEPITCSELYLSARQIARIVQQISFPEEMEALYKGKSIKKQSKLVALSPVLLDGAICLGGRLSHAPISCNAISPIILPKDHPVSHMIVQYYHKIYGHVGCEHVLSFIRQRFWIIKARSLVRQVLKKCVTCRKLREGTMQQQMAPLPKERMIPYEPPFAYTGTDFFGPFYVKRGRGSEKVYGCIFVCFNTRAIHIEDVSSLEADSFIQALRRFMSNRGCPKQIWSDNGTNFVGADREMRKSIRDWNGEVIRKALYKDEVEWYPKWHFQPPGASHMSGVWERLIRSIRNVMRAIIGNTILTKETLRTLFAECVTILNSRPLCCSSDDPEDLEPITPSHLLLQRRQLSIPPGIFEEHDVYSRKQWRRAQFLANCFWKRWLKEYLPMLQQRQKWQSIRRNLSVNDLVMVAESNVPRGHWSLARVTKVFPGKDSLVRVAQVKTKDGTFIRPLSKLCLLEESA